MAEGIECWPCIPRVSGSMPGAGNLKKLFIWMKIQMSQRLEQTSGDNECCSVSSLHSFPTCNLTSVSKNQLHYLTHFNKSVTVERVDKF